MTEIAVDLLADPAGVPRARAMLQRAEWAARAFARYDKPAVDRVIHAAAQADHNAADLGDPIQRFGRRSSRSQ